jgi:hypothetical protein
MRIPKVLLLMFLFSALVTASAQSTYPATTCSESAVQSAYAKEQASAVDGDIITIPAGNCTWTSVWNLSPTHTLTFQGAGAMTPSTSCTFTPGTACTTTSGSDQTELVDGTSGSGMWYFTLAANKTLRITGVEYNTPSSGYSDSGNGQWQFYCGTGNCNLRLDHNHFNGYSGKWLTVWGWGPFGVADHNLVDLYTADTNWVSVFNGIGWNGDNTNYGNGNGSWADDSYWGSSKTFFIENNEFPNDESTYGVYVNDCSNGGRQVFRYNTFESSGNGIQAHEGGGNNRGCRTTEVYGNTSTATGTGSLVGVRSGSDLVWGNIGSWQRIFTPSVDRTNSDNSDWNPDNLGYCGQGDSGTATYSGSTVTWVSSNSQTGSYAFFTNWPDESTSHMVLNGTSYPIASCSSTTSCTLTGLTGSSGSPVPWYAPSQWDQNVTSAGWACYDQPGRGKGDLITGSFSSQNRINSVSGTASWPREAIDPNYVWDNTNTAGGGVCVGIDSSDTNTLVDNRDFFQQFGTGCESGTFNGSTGVGQGLYSAIPATCTPNSATPTTYNNGQAPGVGYWATDQNTLYVCTAKNTWTSWYTPYTYPHPLTLGTDPPSPPSNLSATVQ